MCTVAVATNTPEASPAKNRATSRTVRSSATRNSTVDAIAESSAATCIGIRPKTSDQRPTVNSASSTPTT